MSVEFRQRKPAEIAQAMIKRQKWLILLPMLTMTAAIGYVVYRLPSIYESTSLLTVKPPTISSNLVQSLYERGPVAATFRRSTRKFLSRSSLEPMVQKYDLYKQERACRPADGADHREDVQEHQGRSRGKRRSKRSRHSASDIATATRRPRAT